MSKKGAIEDKGKRPIFRKVTITKPFCPKCDKEMVPSRERAGGMFDWHCMFCNYVC